MNFLEATILGIIQGLTEWLPISSSGHIFLAETYFNLTPSLELAAWLHGGSLLALLIYYWKYIWQITKNLLFLKIIFVSAVSFPIILILEKSGVLYNLSLQTVALTLTITGFLILITHFLFKQEKYESGFVLPSWLLVSFGVVQAFAVLPGISRAGLTIAFLLFVGVSRKQAVDFSFLAAIPLLAGALVFSLADIGIGNISLASPTLWFSFLISFLTSFVGIYYMRKWIENKWVWFAPYCFILATFLLVIY